MACYRETIQITVSLRRVIGQNPRAVPSRAPLPPSLCSEHSFFSWHWCVTLHSKYWHPKSSPELLWQSSHWDFIAQAWLMGGRMVECSFQVDWCWVTKATTLRPLGVASPTLRSVVSSSCPKQRHSHQVGHRWPPGSRVQRPHLSLGKAKFFTIPFCCCAEVF